MMESRRASVVSNASMRQRKFSSDRLLRQAELSARLEEGHPVVAQLDRLQEVADEDKAAHLESQGINSLARADSSISPFDIHPGQRLRNFTFGSINGANSHFDFGAHRPWKEPSPAQQEDIERRAAVVHRAETASLDLDPMRDYLRQSVAEHESQSPLRSLKFWRRKHTKAPGTSVAKGMHVAAAMHATLGLEFIAQKSPDWFKRQQLHVFEYKTSRFNSFSVGSNLAFHSTESLRSHLHELETVLTPSPEERIVRLIHVRNNVEAFKFIDGAFAMASAESQATDRVFGDWMREERDPKRTSNMTIRWRPTFDINRHISCMAIGLDLGISDVANEKPMSKKAQGSPKDNPLLPKRRVAIYMQRTLSAATPNPKILQYTSKGQVFADFAKQDNIVIYESSSDAWSEFAHTPTLLGLAPFAGISATGSAAVMASVMGHIFWEIVSKWQSQITAIHQPFADLEDLIHGQPSDISHSPRVWEWSRHLQTMLKLVVRHLKAVQTFQEDFELFSELESPEWLNDILVELKHIADTIREDYIEPLEHMIDLMYKSVTIHDSRLSLELGTSLWRLSWVTFIFLPLTFLVGFFGMNVGVFKNDPSIKWYFVALVPLAILIIVFWFTFNRLSVQVFNSGVRRKSNTFI